MQRRKVDEKNYKLKVILKDVLKWLSVGMFLMSLGREGGGCDGKGSFSPGLVRGCDKLEKLAF